jgi:hypothetical protein
MKTTIKLCDGTVHEYDDADVHVRQWHIEVWLWKRVSPDRGQSQVYCYPLSGIRFWHREERKNDD